MIDIVSQFRGKGPDEIAGIIRKHKIKGRMGTTHNCPMALLLSGIDTGHYVIGRKYIVRQCGKRIDQVRTPEGVAQFVRKFDIGGYPDLVAPPPRCVAQGAKSKKPPGYSGDGRKTPTRRKREVKNHLAKLVERFAQ